MEVLLEVFVYLNFIEEKKKNFQMESVSSAFLGTFCLIISSKEAVCMEARILRSVLLMFILSNNSLSQ